MRAGTDKLERFISKAGVLSRQEARFAVRRGDVRLNGRCVLDPWQLVEPGRDYVEMAGIGEVRLPDWRARPPSIVVFNKPKDVVVTLRRDDSTLRGRQSLYESLPMPWRGCLAPHVPALRPVGRLDAQSMGLLLLTDSSGLAARLMEPGTCEKEYILRVHPAPSEGMLERLRAGVEIKDGNPGRGPTLPCRVERSQVGDQSSVSRAPLDAVLRFTITEGRNRQLRRMCDAVGLTVEWLMRLRVGPVELRELPLGEAREVTDEERAALFSHSGP